jgi:hypothetical protein
MLIETYNEYHLGDQFIHLNYLYRAVPLNPEVNWVHYCKADYIDQLQHFVPREMPIQLKPLERRGLNCWIGHENYFYSHHERRHWANFHMQWFERLSSKLGVKNPIRDKSDLLAGFDVLRKPATTCDVLIINSPPGSGQLPDFNQKIFDRVASNLYHAGLRVITIEPLGFPVPATRDYDLKLHQIGRIRFNMLIGVDTGPLWPTYNQFQKKEAARVIIGSTSDIFGLTPTEVTCQTMADFEANFLSEIDPQVVDLLSAAPLGRA